MGSKHHHDSHTIDTVSAALGTLLARSPIGGYILWGGGLFMLFGAGASIAPENGTDPLKFFVAGLFLVGFALLLALHISNRAKFVMLIISAAVYCIGLFTGLVYLPAQKYNQASAYMNQGNYAQAKDLFEDLSLRNHKDSAQRAAECEAWLRYMNSHRQGSGLTDAQLQEDYNRTLGYMEAGQYKLAKVWFDWLGDYRDSPEKALECTNYIEYEQIVNRCNYPQLLTTAYRQLLGMKGFAPADELRSSPKFQKVRESILSVGGYVWFGHWEEQDSIPWIILARDGNKALLLCNEIQIRRDFTDLANLPWADSPLRQWLNQDFLQAHFTAEEQALICPTRLDNGDEGNPPTQDLIFLLSSAEVYQYLPEAEDRQLSEYVNSNLTFSWLLRTTGAPGPDVEYINKNGELEKDSTLKGNRGVRPVVWVILDPDFF